MSWLMRTQYNDLVTSSLQYTINSLKAGLEGTQLISVLISIIFKVLLLTQERQSLSENLAHKLILSEW